MAQKTLLEVVNTISAELGLPQSATVVSSTNTNTLKLLALIRAACDDLMNEYNWQVLDTRYTFTTTAGTDNYPLPVDLERFIGGTFYDQNNRWPMTGPLTGPEWEEIKVSQLTASPFYKFRIMANKMFVFPTPGTSTYTFNYEYVSNAYCTSSAGVAQTAFQQDSDKIVLDYRCVVYGAKLKWLASVNMDTTAALVDYARALDSAKSTDSAPRTLYIGGRSAGIRLLSHDNIPDTGFGV